MELPRFGQPINDLRPIIKVLDGRVGVLGLYCQNDTCVVRAFKIEVKPYGEDVPVKPVCPFCRSEKHILFSFLHTREMRDKHALENALHTLAGYSVSDEFGVVNLGEVWTKVEELRAQFVKPKRGDGDHGRVQ